MNFSVLMCEWFLHSSILEWIESNISKINWLRDVILFHSNSVGTLGQVFIVSHFYQIYFVFSGSDLNLDCYQHHHHRRHHHHHLMCHPNPIYHYLHYHWAWMSHTYVDLRINSQTYFDHHNDKFNPLFTILNGQTDCDACLPV